MNGSQLCFRWPSGTGANTVQVTGNFHDWKQGLYLQRQSDGHFFVDFGLCELNEITFKFIIDECDWKVSDECPIITDAVGNQNNFLTGEEITTYSTLWKNQSLGVTTNGHGEKKTEENHNDVPVITNGKSEETDKVETTSGDDDKNNGNIGETHATNGHPEKDGDDETHTTNGHSEEKDIGTETQATEVDPTISTDETPTNGHSEEKDIETETQAAEVDPTINTDETPTNRHPEEENIKVETQPTNGNLTKEDGITNRHSEKKAIKEEDTQPIEDTKNSNQDANDTKKDVKNDDTQLLEKSICEDIKITVEDAEKNITEDSHQDASDDTENITSDDLEKTLNGGHGTNGVDKTPSANLKTGADATTKTQTEKSARDDIIRDDISESDNGDFQGSENGGGISGSEIWHELEEPAIARMSESCSTFQGEQGSLEKDRAMDASVEFVTSQRESHTTEEGTSQNGGENTSSNNSRSSCVIT